MREQRTKAQVKKNNNKKQTNKIKQELGLREVDLEPSSKRGSDKINMLK